MGGAYNPGAVLSARGRGWQREGRALERGGGARGLTLALIGRGWVSDGLVALWGLRGGVRLRRSEEWDEGMPREYGHRARLHVGPHCRSR